jgi:hypothetical protein
MEGYEFDYASGQCVPSGMMRSVGEPTTIKEGDKDMGWMAAATFGGDALGALGQAFMGPEESSLSKRQAEQQRQETATYKGAQQPTIMLANYYAKDEMLQKGGAGDMARLLNMGDFAMNQVIPYLQASSAQGGERRQNPNAAGPVRQAAQGMINNPGPVRQGIQAGLNQRQGGGMSRNAGKWGQIRDRLGGMGGGQQKPNRMAQLLGGRR